MTLSSTSPSLHLLHCAELEHSVQPDAFCTAVHPTFGPGVGGHGAGGGPGVGAGPVHLHRAAGQLGGLE